jgi:hypothetical protein
VGGGGGGGGGGGPRGLRASGAERVASLKVARLRKDGGAVRRDRACVHACEIVPQAGA